MGWSHFHIKANPSISVINQLCLMICFPCNCLISTSDTVLKQQLPRYKQQWLKSTVAQPYLSVNNNLGCDCSHNYDLQSQINLQETEQLHWLNNITSNQWKQRQRHRQRHRQLKPWHFDILSKMLNHCVQLLTYFFE